MDNVQIEEKKPLITKGWDLVNIEEYKANKLPILTINLSRLCNLSCIYCHTNAGKKDNDEINIDTIKQIIDSSVDLGNKVLWIAGRGEPTIDPNFRNVVEHANKKGLTTILNTNAVGMTEDLAEFLFSHNVSPEVKIPVFDNLTYTFLSGKSENSNVYDKFLEGLNSLNKAGYGKDIEETEENRITRISGQILLTKQAYSKLGEVFSYCNEHNYTPVVSEIIPGGRVLKNRNLEELAINKEDNNSLFKVASQIMGYDLGEKEDCHIKYGIFIENNGDILVDNFGMSCDIQIPKSTKVIGNIKNIPLTDGWGEILKMRSNSLIGEENFCGSNCFYTCSTERKAIEHYYNSIKSN